MTKIRNGRNLKRVVSNSCNFIQRSREETWVSASWIWAWLTSVACLACGWIRSNTLLPARFCKMDKWNHILSPIKRNCSKSSTKCMSYWSFTSYSKMRNILGKQWITCTTTKQYFKITITFLLTFWKTIKSFKFNNCKKCGMKVQLLMRKMVTSKKKNIVFCILFKAR